MRSRLVREVGALLAGLAGATLAVWLLVTFVVAGEWVRFALAVGVLICAGVTVWMGRYDPAAAAARRERRAQPTARTGEDGRVRMPTLPPRR